MTRSRPDCSKRAFKPSSCTLTATYSSNRVTLDRSGLGAVLSCCRTASPLPNALLPDSAETQTHGGDSRHGHEQAPCVLYGLC